MKLVNRLLSWLEGLGGGAWIVLQSVLALVAVTGADLIVNELSNHHTWAARVALVVALIVGAVAYFWVALVASRVRDRIFPKHPSTVLALQRELGDALASENQLIAERGGRMCGGADGSP